MSEYQHYEWQTVDRLLTDKEFGFPPACCPALA